MVRFPWQRPPQPDNLQSSESPSGLGTFGGVYTPSILTILGVIMYLRFGWVIGNVGWGGALAIVTLSTSITFLTGLSISSISTDRVVRVGGAYYMISRSLGIETGGAVGIPLYFAQAISVALYTIGFAESLVRTFPVLSNAQTAIALITTIVVAALAIKSANLAIRAQYFIMAAIALSLLSFAFGRSIAPSDVPTWPSSSGESFWSVFAVFFPAVTGIMAGVNMSGDLRDPSKSIPVGTLAAIGTGYVIYMVLPLFLAQRADIASLLDNPLVMRDIALWGDAILLGVWGATLSSALGSILGAPRVLQALARDGVLPRSLRWLGRGSGAGDEPRLGTLVTLGVAVAAVCLGDLNLIAPVLTMFFLSTYMVLNVAAALEGFLQSPSFRPTFRVPWLFSAVGAIGCLMVMMLINAVAAVVAALFVLGVYIWLERRELQTAWGDVRRGLWSELARMAIFSLDDTPDPKNWRPHVLVLSGAPTRRWPLIDLAAAFTHNRGLVSVASILPSGSRDIAQQTTLENKLREYMAKRGVQALVRIVTAPDPFVGAERLIEAYGIGSLVPNTVLLGDSEQEHLRHDYCQLISTLHRSGRSVAILRENSDLGFGQRRRIDVWWGGLHANGSLMLLLAYLLRTGSRWRGATICLKLVVPNETAAQAARSNLESLTQQLRIGAMSQVLVSDGRPFREILHESSRSADLVCLGMATPNHHKDKDFSDYYKGLQEMASGLPTTVFVLAASDFAFEEVLQQDNPTLRRA
ncbi:MAG: Na-K-Cl cotransporter [Cyanobacteria bacterium SID2]|nr:Na-K-Cl cotransporter [Cyanobacteria bacterium SID2]MBP0006759.1 Na-K-Cl cotransporter [Cyanobacteria bacterium SBC]